MKIYGKKTALQRLELFYKSGRMPHALLITGDDGVGKRTLADYAAMLMLCENGGEKPCMQCSRCRRIEAHIYPDVVYPLGDMKDGKYNAEGLRSFIASCSSLPNDGPLRVCIFEHTEEMNEICQNALLKFIEEPSRFNRFIFTASDKTAVLETIISRVTEIKADLCEKTECISALSEKNIPSDRAESLYRVFGGNIGRCIAADGDESRLALFRLSEKIASAVLKKNEYECMTGFASLKNRNDLSEVLKNISDIFGNAAAVYAGGTPYGFFSRLSEDIAAKMSVKKINKIYETAPRLLRAMDFNPNVQLAAANCCAEIFSAAEGTNGARKEL